MSKAHIMIGAPRFDLEKYLNKKSNQNLLIVGAPGQGKSKLMRLALETLPNPKLIFNFKEGDEYLKMDGNVIQAEQFFPDPFADPDAFTNAIAVAFNVTSEGIQASIAMSLARRLAKASKSWADFAKNAKATSAHDTNTRAAASYLLEKMSSLTYKSKPAELDLDAKNILDLSRMNEEAKLFYAELFLRQLYKQIRARSRDQPKVIVCVDEAHRLTKNVYGKYQSVLNEMSREIRAFGMLWTATQNLTDMPGPIRSTFETQFCFNTTNEDDMHALAAINRDLSKAVSSLKKHQFIDAKRDDIHDKIPIFKADLGGLVDKELPVLTKIDAMAAEPVEALIEPDRPTATLWLGLRAIYENDGASLAKLAKYAKAKGLSEPTIYGFKGKNGIFENAVSLNYAEKTEKGYKLTDKGRKWIDAPFMIRKNVTDGSDLHKQLLIKTIQYLHVNDMLVTIPEKGPDLIACPVDKKKKYLWDDKARRAYEIQTAAIKDNILTNRRRNSKLGLQTIWVTYNKKISREISKLTDNEDEYLLIKV